MSRSVVELAETAAELVAAGEARAALVADPIGWCRERRLGGADIAILVSEIRSRAAALQPADRRVVLASCFALGSAVRG